MLPSTISSSWRPAGRFSVITLSLALLSIFFIPALPHAATLRVPAQYPRIQQAIDAAQAGDQVWINEGTYSETISLKTGVGVYGGFAGMETTLSQRSIAEHPTILDGSKARNGQPASRLIEATTVTGVSLDGMTFTGALVPSSNNPNNGVLYSFCSDISFANCKMLGNRAYGAVCYAQKSIASFSDCLLQDNTTGYGAAIWGNDSTLTLRHCSIIGNSGGVAAYPVSRSFIMEKTLVSGNIRGLSIAGTGSNEAVIENSVISGNRMGIMAWNSKKRLVNCIVSGSDQMGFYTDGATTVTNCLFDSISIDKNTWSDPGASFDIRGGYACCINSIIATSDHCLGIYCQSDYGIAFLHNNLFIGNGVRVRAGYQLKNYLSSNELNMKRPYASGNMDGDAMFEMDGPNAVRGRWTSAPTYDATRNRTTFYVAPGTFAPGALAGRLINPNTTQTLQAYITANTSSTIEAPLDMHAIASKGSEYVFVDYRLRNGSAAIDRADTWLAPATDINGLPRPGTDGQIDVGPFEAAPEYQPVSDTIRPVSSLQPLPELITTATVLVSYIASDAESGLRHVELYYSRDNGPWSRYGEYFNASPIVFDSTKTGGDGYYNFYSIATDNAGNIEYGPTSADAWTRIITHSNSPRLYVKAEGPLGTGKSWTSPLKTISEALAVGKISAVPVYEIWVAEGTYNDTAVVPSNVGIYGGFKGDETTLEQRDYIAHGTVIEASRWYSYANGESNSSSSGFFIKNAHNVRIDGFTVTKGKGSSTGQSGLSGCGGGVFLQNCDKSVIVANCRMLYNYAWNCGGGLFSDNASPVIVNCEFLGNVAGYGGGCGFKESTPTLESCLFEGNYSSGSSAVLSSRSSLYAANIAVCGNIGYTAVSVNGGKCIIRNSTVSDNKLRDTVSNSMASLVASSCQKVDISNCIFSGNDGYGISANTSSTIRNCLFFNNSKGAYIKDYAAIPSAKELNEKISGASENIDDSPMFQGDTSEALRSTWTSISIDEYDYSFYWNHYLTLSDANAHYPTNSLVGRLIQFTLNTGETRFASITSNTLTSISVSGFESDKVLAGTAYRFLDYHLSPMSPCIDAGVAIADVTYDIDGDRRPIKSHAQPGGDGSGYDIGADEFPFAASYDSTHPPARPVNISPADGVFGVASPVVLKASPFSDPLTTDTQLASRWQLSADSTFTHPVFDSLGVPSHTTYTLPSGAVVPYTVYYWRVQYCDSSFGWSEWSAPTSFSSVSSGPNVRVPGDYATIQDAIDKTPNATEIVLAPGTYKVNLVFPNKSLTLRSEDPTNSATVASTILDGQWKGPVVTLRNIEAFPITVAGLTITNGTYGITGAYRYNPNNGESSENTYAAILKNRITGNGTGIVYVKGCIEDNDVSRNQWGLGYCKGSVVRNTVSRNSSTGTAAGLIYCLGEIRDNRIFLNKVTDNYDSGNGAGLCACSGQITGNLILANSASGRGGGIYNCYGTIENNRIMLNEAAREGDGIYQDYNWYKGNPIFRSNIVAMNNIEAGGTPLFGNTIWSDSSTPSQTNGAYKIVNCIVWDYTTFSDYHFPDYNTTITANCFRRSEKEKIGTNIVANPLLADPDHGDFHLLPTSPCIDKGALIADLKTDFEGDPRGVRTLSNGTPPYYDIGADEFTTATRSFTYPNQPQPLSPIRGEIYSTVTLRITAFEHPNPKAEYVKTMWQISTSSDLSYLPPTPSVRDDSTSYVIPPGRLYPGWTYYWRARYVDDHGGISSWSPTASFQYVAAPPIYVPDDYPTIQKALDNAMDGDVVIVRPGTYRENLLIPHRGIALSSTDPHDPAIVDSTIIDGGKSGSVITAWFTTYSLIEGFTITNGKAEEGGGINALLGDVSIRFNHIRNNEATYGGGVAHGNHIECNIITHNTATVAGGGLWECSSPSSNVVAWNSAGEGGGCANCGEINSCTIYGNRATTRGGGISDSRIVNGCIVWGNIALPDPQLSNTSPGNSYVMGDIYYVKDPLFEDPERDNFHLLPNSPCIDRLSGISDIDPDFDGERRPDILYSSNTPYDFGADECYPRFTYEGMEYGLMMVGEKPFSDLALQIKEVPPVIHHQFYIRLRNSDSNSSDFSLRIKLFVRSNIYVAIDPRISGTPAWLSIWENVPGNLGAAGQTGRILFRKEFAAGEVTLGANRDKNGPEAPFMYIPIIVPIRPENASANREWLRD